MSAEPLTREEREANYAKSARLTRSERDLIDRYEATVQAAEERAERLRVALLVAEEAVHDQQATWLSCHPARRAIADAIAADDAARGER